MAAASVTLGSKGSSLTSAGVFAVATNTARITIDSSAIRSSSVNSTADFKFSLPKDFTAEEVRASLFLLLNKISLLSSSPSATTQLLQILEQKNVPSGIDYTINGVASDDLGLLDITTAAIAGVSAVIDHCSAALVPISDAVAAISCEALGINISPFNLIDSGDGSTLKDEVGVAADLKVFLNDSKLVKSGKESKLVNLGTEFPEFGINEIPEVHGGFRDASRLLHSKARVQLNSGFRAGSSVIGMSNTLLYLAQSLSSLGCLSISRARFIVESKIADKDLSSSLLKLLDDKCPVVKNLKELCDSSCLALSNKDYLLCLHKVYELLDAVRMIVSWEGVTAFVALEGSEVFAEKIVGDNGVVSEPSSGDNAKTKKKSEKKKKVVLGKGTAAFLQFIKEELLQGAKEIGLESFSLNFIALLNPRGSGFDGLVKRLKDIVESNESLKRPKLPKGTRDFSKEQMTIREKAFSIISNVFKRHGAMALDTPVFEMRETLTGKYGEDSKLIYDLADQGGELCSLRYDLTVPFARYVAMNGLTSFKRYQIAKVYRRDNPSKGRYREFYQCDFDIAGSFEKMGPDFEVIKILTEMLDELDIGNYEVKLNHRKLLDGMLALCGVPEIKFRTICSSIDKLDKQTFEQIKKEMVEEKGLDVETADKIGTFVKLRGSPVELLSKLQAEGSEFLKNSDAELALKELEILFKALEKAKCTSKIVFDLSLARGLDYYTGIIYEAVFKGTTQVGSIAAGGRYDNLIGMFGTGTKQVPAVGVSLGIERVFTIMEQLQKDKNQEVRATETQVLVSILGEDLAVGAELASELWGADLKAEFLVNKRRNKHIDRAIDSKIPYMVLVGDQELKDDTVKLRDMNAKTEETVPRAEIVKKLKELPKITSP